MISFSLSGTSTEQIPNLRVARFLGVGRHPRPASPIRQLEAQRSSPSDANQASLAEALSRFKDLYADYGKHRKTEVGCADGI